MTSYGSPSDQELGGTSNPCFFQRLAASYRIRNRRKFGTFIESGGLMTTLLGRSVFVVEAPALVRFKGNAGIADRAARAHLASVWIRTGHGPKRDPGLTAILARDLKTALQAHGVALWGWHIPRCADDTAVTQEVHMLDSLVTELALDGIIIDAERTTRPQRFQGNAAQARVYMIGVSQAMARAGKGIAFSSHDQPNLHRELPFSEFLAVSAPTLPQVYSHDRHPRTRLEKSEAAYRPLLGAEFQGRYMPTSNGSMVGDGAFASEDDCVVSAGRFLNLVAERGYLGHSFWCWEEMPAGLWALLESRAH